MDLIRKAVKKGYSALSEYESKQILAEYGIPCTREIMVTNLQELGDAAEEIGFPLVLKGCGRQIAHKTEKGLIRVDVRNLEEAIAAFREIMKNWPGQTAESWCRR